MSGRPKKRTRCQSCNERCQVRALEVLERGGTGWRGYWQWWQRTLCPRCQVIQLQLLGRPRGTFAPGVGGAPTLADVEDLEAIAAWG